MRIGLSAIGRAWDRIELFIGGLFLTVSVLLIVLQVAARSLFSYSFIGADEIAGYAIIWSILFTASLAVKSNQHIRIDIIFTLVPRKAGRVLDLFGTLLSIFFAAYLTYAGWELVDESIFLGERSMSMLNIQMWIPQIILPLGGGLLTLRLVQRFIWLLRGNYGSQEADSPVLSI